MYVSVRRFGRESHSPALQAAASRGAAALVVGGVVDSDIVSYLGHDIGVAITGQEPVVTTVILTEGFGGLQMAARTWELLSSLEGQKASVNGATQIRAGVIRPDRTGTERPSPTRLPLFPVIAPCHSRKRTINRCSSSGGSGVLIR